MWSGCPHCLLSNQQKHQQWSLSRNMAPGYIMWRMQARGGGCICNFRCCLLRVFLLHVQSTSGLVKTCYITLSGKPLMVVVTFTWIILLPPGKNVVYCLRNTTMSLIFLIWPLNSPHFNLFEHIWNLPHRELGSVKTPPHNVRALLLTDTIGHLQGSGVSQLFRAVLGEKKGVYIQLGGQS